MSEQRLDGKSELEVALAVLNEKPKIHYPNRDYLLTALCSRVFGAEPVFNDDSPKPGLPAGIPHDLATCQQLLANILRALPVGYIPNHTPESAPDQIRELVEENVRLSDQLDDYTAASIHSCGANCKRPNCVLRRQVADLQKEVLDLRLIFPQILEALGNGAQCTAQCSLEFLQEIPNEVKLYIDRRLSQIKSDKEAKKLSISDTYHALEAKVATLNPPDTCDSPSASS